MSTRLDAKNFVCIGLGYPASKMESSCAAGTLQADYDGCEFLLGGAVMMMAQVAYEFHDKKSALRPPPSRDVKEADRQVERGRRALEARQVGATIRRGKTKSFRPVVGRI